FPRPNDNAAKLCSDLSLLSRFGSDHPTSEVRRARVHRFLKFAGGPGRSKPEIEAIFGRLLRAVSGETPRDATNHAEPPVPAAAAQEPREVSHAKFGRGHVIRVLDGANLVVRFEDGTERTLLGRVLTDVTKG